MKQDKIKALKEAQRLQLKKVEENSETFGKVDWCDCTDEKRDSHYRVRWLQNGRIFCQDFEYTNGELPKDIKH